MKAETLSRLCENHYDAYLPHIAAQGLNKYAIINGFEIANLIYLIQNRSFRYL